jgi:hypothetical protein
VPPAAAGCELTSQPPPAAGAQVRVHRLKQPGLYRFPVHLELLEPSAWVPKITAPHEWESPIDMRYCEAQGWSVDDIMAHTGRSYVRASYYLQVRGGGGPRLAARSAAAGAEGCCGGGLLAAAAAARRGAPAPCDGGGSPAPRLAPRAGHAGAARPWGLLPSRSSPLTPSTLRPLPHLQDDRAAKMDEIQEAYGWDEPDTNGRDDDDVTRALAWHQDEIEAAALSF